METRVTLVVDRHFTDGILKGVIRKDDTIAVFQSHAAALEWVRSVNGQHVRGRLNYFVDNWRISPVTKAC
jgi:hypothetical protein